MGLSAVAAVLEGASSIARRHRAEGSAHRLYERLAGTCPSPAQQRLELRERFFDAIEIGGVGRQVHELAAPLLDELAHLRAFGKRGCPSLPPAPAEAMASAPAPGRPRRPPSWSSLRPPGTDPSLPRSCSPAR